jgi:solute carrier family 25 carnitine/acylcarnitine transporter 20/29
VKVIIHVYVVINVEKAITPSEIRDKMSSNDLTSDGTVIDLRTVLMHACAGTVGGVAGIYTGNPFDVVKVRMQISHRSALSLAGELWAREGIRGFFRGAAAVSLAQAPVNAVIFAANATTLRALERSSGAAPGAPAAMSSIVAAGCVAGLGQAFVLSPFELLKVQQQTTTPAGGGVPLSLSQTARSIVGALGPTGLFRGLMATIIRDAPTFGLYFSSYEIAKRAGAAALGVGQGSAPPASVLLSAGAIAGASSWAVALPADIIKSVVQAAPLDASRESLRWLNVATRIWRAGGFKAFFRGFVPCVVRSLPVNAVTFYGYEMALEALVK